MIVYIELEDNDNVDVMEKNNLITVNSAQRYFLYGTQNDTIFPSQVLLTPGPWRPLIHN